MYVSVLYDECCRSRGEVLLEQSSEEAVACSLVATFYRLIAPRKVRVIYVHTHCRQVAGIFGGSTHTTGNAVHELG
jgi:hypothetical protein